MDGIEVVDNQHVVIVAGRLDVYLIDGGSSFLAIEVSSFQAVVAAFLERKASFAERDIDRLVYGFARFQFDRDN